MKFVISAAGRGTRLGALTKETPKCLLKVRGRAIIDYAIENIKKLGPEERDIGIVVGFQKEKIIKHLEGGEYNFIINDNYAETNDMASFYLSRDFVGNDDCIFLHSDVFFHPRILESCFYASGGNYLVVDTKKWNEESMKVSAKDGYMMRAGKDLPDSETCGDWIGIAKFEKDDISDVYGTIKNLLDKGEQKNWIATGCFNEMARDGRKFRILPTADYPWIEIDFEHELRRADDVIYGLMR